MRVWLAALAVIACFWPALAQAQVDEIQVYDAAIAKPGTFNLTWHNNYTLSGRKTPDFPGGLVPDHTLNGVTEWAYGVTDWFEAGLYAPLYSVSSSGNVKFDGVKLRALFVAPGADSRTLLLRHQFRVQLQFAQLGYQALHLGNPPDPGPASGQIRYRLQSDPRQFLRRHLAPRLRALHAPCLSRDRQGRRRAGGI